MNQSRDFLEALFHDKPDGLYLLVWTLQGDHKRSRWFRDVQQAATYVSSLRGCNVYVGIGLSPSDFGEFKRCDSENVAGLVGIGVDIDMKSDAHPKGTRPETIDQALSILPPEFPPSIIVETGNGIQAWWLFKEPLIFGNDEDRHEGAAIIARWQTLLKYAAQRKGWTFEKLGDLARVLRVPGTQNVKDPANPKNVVIRASSDRRYNPSDFRDYLDGLAIPTEDEQTQDTKKWADQFSDKPMVISITAAIPDELLAGWMEQDARFSRTWNHQRDDMNDTSQSGYDLALANYGIRKGLTDQQIVDLIIHNRRLHGSKQCKSLDYYRRTLSTARNGLAKETMHFPHAATPLSAADRLRDDGGAARNESDPNAKARLCDQISTALGVQILRIVKLTGQDPIYVVELDTGSIHFPNAGKFISQQFVKTAIAASAGKMLRRFRPLEWDRLAQMMLDACTEREGTDDLQLKGFAKLQIDQYLDATRVLGSPDLLQAHDLLAPVIDKDRVTISSTHFMWFINKSGSQSITVKAAAAMIIAVGGEAVRFRRGVKEQSRWALPADDWNPEDYAAGARELSNAQ